MAVTLRCGDLFLVLFIALTLLCPASARAQLPKVPAVSISISRSKTTMYAGETQVFAALISGSGDSAVRWSIAELGGGTITEQGLYTAPKLPGVYHLKAMWANDPSRLATATIIVLAYCDPPIGFSR